MDEVERLRNLSRDVLAIELIKAVVIAHDEFLDSNLDVNIRNPGWLAVANAVHDCRMYLLRRGVKSYDYRSK